MTELDIASLEKLAQENDGHCTHCHQKIGLYRHSPNVHFAPILRAMADVVEERQRSQLMPFAEANEVNFNDIAGGFNVVSQRSKMRQHGLIAKFKVDGKHKPNTWLITNKGWSFLKGEPIPETVVIYDNKVLGHEGGLVTIHQLLGEPQAFEQEAISTAEAGVYGQAREPKVVLTQAVYKGVDRSGLKRGVTYDIGTGKLQVGKSLEVFIGKGNAITYKDIASFQRDWKVL